MNNKFFRKIIGLSLAAILAVSAMTPTIRSNITKADTTLEPISYLDANGGYNGDTVKAMMDISNTTTYDFSDFTATQTHTVKSEISNLNIATWDAKSNYPTLTGATYALFWIKTSKNISINLKFWADGSKQASKGVNIVATNGWQKVTVELPTSNGHWADITAHLAKVTVDFTNSGNDAVVIGDKFEYGRIYFFNAEPTEYTTFSPPQQVGYMDAKCSNNDVNTTKIQNRASETEDFTDFATTLEHEVLSGITKDKQVTTWKATDDKIDITGANYAMFWVKTSKEIKIKLRFFSPDVVEGGKTVAWTPSGYVDVIIPGAIGWQKVTVDLSEVEKTTKYWEHIVKNNTYISVAFNDVSNILTGDTFEYGRMYYYDKNPKDVSTLKPEYSQPAREIANIDAQDSYADENAGVTVEKTITRDFNSFDQTTKVTVTDKDTVIANEYKLAHVWKVSDANYKSIEGAKYALFWVKTSKEISLTMRFYSTNYELGGVTQWSPSAKKDIVIHAAEGWQRVIVKLPTEIGVNTEATHWAHIEKELTNVAVRLNDITGIENGDTFEYGRMYFYDKEPKVYPTLKLDFNSNGILDEADYTEFETKLSTLDVEAFDYDGDGKISDFDKKFIKAATKYARGFAEIIDVNNDGNSNTQDLIRLKKLMGDLDTSVSDRDGDGESNAQDVAFTVHFLLTVII